MRFVAVLAIELTAAACGNSAAPVPHVDRKETGAL
jgi:hypothetical protein